jgi:[lysine-biosynthesis-protein LysW]--L-2-aminoadipate ligase
MKLGIILNRVNFEEKQIIKACERLDLPVEQVNNQNLKLNLAHQKDLESKCDLFLQRSLSHSRSEYTTAIFESKGYRIINNSSCISNCGNKLLATCIMTKHGIPTPQTWVAFTPDEALEIAGKNLPYPVICKPIIGSWGRMVAKLNDYEAAQALFEARDVMGDIFQQILYIQEYIDTSKVRSTSPTDIRVFYIGGKCVAAIGRYRNEANFRSNISIGGTAKPYEITPEVEKICRTVASAFQGEILGIDLMETENGYVCIEVNAVPGFQGLSTTCNVDIGEKIVEYLKESYSK